MSVLPARSLDIAVGAGASARRANVKKKGTEADSGRLICVKTILRMLCQSWILLKS
jgi:hypothetical protein